ncbi:MAG: MBL fold metallo-hydrolase [Desulfomonilaceae bacterium]|nr:MBL fold metallo-hydrolase [Desulfomonilaceae bacterium]
MIKSERIGEIRKFLLARTLAGRAVYFTTAYFVDGLMVDTGCVFTIRELVDALDGLEVATIVNTHSHEDHTAANSALQAKYGAEILAHTDALPILADPRLKPLRPYQHVMWGRPPSSKGSPIPPYLETTRYRFQVIHTPGHSADHICLFEPDQGWLFVGDAYVGGFDRSLRADYNIWQIIDSLKKLAWLKPAVLFPGSGTVRSNAYEELASKIDYLETMGHRVDELYRKGWSRRRIRRKLFGPEMFIAYFTLGHFSGRNLVRSYIEDRAG